jgi:hypothetical protein
LNGLLNSNTFYFHFFDHCMTAFRYRLALVAACFQLIIAGTPMFAQTLQPSKTGLPGRTVWALTTTASGSGAARQTFTFAATDKGLWRSSDNGGVWTETTLKNQAIYAVKARTVGGTSTMLAATDKGILRSVDGGTTWQSPEVTTGTVISTSNILQLKKVFDIEIIGSTWYAATNKGVFRSTTDGRTWTLLNIDRTVDNNEVRGITAEGSTIIVNLWKEGLWRSTNNGGSWAKLTIAGETSLSKTVSMMTGLTRVQRGNTLTTATVSMVFVGAVSGNLWRSQDNGTTWTKILAAGAATRLSSNAPTGIDAMTSVGTRIIGGTPNGLALSDNYGASWNLVQTSVTQPVSILAHDDKRTVTVGIEQSAQTTALEKNTATVAGTAPGTATFSIAASTAQACPVNVTGFSPASLPAGSPGQTIIIYGQNFPSADISFFIQRFAEGTSTLLGTVTLGYTDPQQGVQVVYQSPTSVALTLPASWFSVAARIGVNTATQCPTVGLGATFYVTGAPTLTQSSVSQLFRTGLYQNVNLTGTNFIDGTTKIFYSLNSGARTEINPVFVTVNSATSIRVTVPPDVLAATGTLAFTAENAVGSPSLPLNVLVHNPLPAIQSVSPTSYTRNSGLPITITGTGFVPETQLRYDNQPNFYFPTYISPTQVRFTPLGQYNTGGASGTAPSFQILVQNPVSSNGQGGGVSANTTIPILNPVPSLSSISPAQVFVGSSRTIALTGTFLPNSTVNFNNKSYPIALVGFATYGFVLPPGDLAQTGSFLVTMTTPAPGGGTSTNQVFLNVVNPQPTATSLSPTTVNAGVNATITITGTDILPSSLVYMENVPDALTTTVVNSTTIRAVVPGTRITANGTYRFNIVNPPPTSFSGGASGFVSLIVNTPLANLTGISPTTLTASAATPTLTLTGSLFESTAVAWISGAGITTQALTTTFTNASSLTATLPATIANRAGTYTVTVRNPNAPDSQGQTLTVQNPRPRLNTLSATTSLVGASSLTLTATGSNFAENIQAFANGVPCSTTRTTGNLTGSLTLTIPQHVLAQAGLVRIALQNPAPRQTPDFSDTLTVTVENPIARLDSLAPVPLVVSTQASTVTLYGTNFIGLSVASDVSVLPATVIPTTWLSQTQLSASIPVSLTTTTGLRTFTVINPLTTVPMPARVNVNVVNPTPFAQRITPSVVTQNLDTSSANDRTLIITGDRFVAGVEVLLNNQAVTITETTPTRLTVKIPAGRIVARGNYTVVVRNPVTNGTDGGAAQTLTLTVNTPQAVVSGITLSGSASGQVPLDTLNVPLVITGSQFLDSLTVRLIPPGGGAGVVLSLTSVSSTELRATIPFGLLPTGGVYSLVVTNPTPTNAPSLAQTFAVVNPVPELDSITTLLGRALVGSAAPQSIRLFGRRFTPTSVVRWRDTVLATTFVSRYELSAELPPSQQTRGNVGAVSVFTPTDGVVLNGNAVGGGTGFAPAPFGTLFVSHAVPTLSALGSSTVVRDAWNPAALAPLSLTGLMITSTSTVRVQAVDTLSAVNVVLTPTSRTASSLTVSLPRSVLQTTGVFRVSITNPPAFAQALSAPDGGTSSELALTVVNPPPSLSSITPSALAVASVGTTPLALTGTNFTPESVLLVNGRTWTRTVVSASSITASLPDSLFTLSGFVSVRVVNPAPVQTNPALTGRGDSSNVLSIEIFNPVPTLTTIAPVFAPITGRAATDSVSVTLVGTNFVRNSLVRLVSTIAASVPVDLKTVYRSRDTLVARMLAADFRAGTFNMAVVNPAPRGGVSVARRFTVTNPMPVLSGLIPGTTTATGKAWTLTLTGQYFTATSQVSYRNALQSLTNTSFVADTLTADGVQDTLRVKLAAVPVGDTTFPVAVYNPPTGGVGGGASDTMRLAVGLPFPVITTISPVNTTATLGVIERRGTLIVNGTGFDDVAKVLVNGLAVQTEFVSTTRLRAYLPDSLQRGQARRTVRVQNTPVLVSNSSNATWYNPVPDFTTLAPNLITAGRDTTLVLAGDKFAPNASVALVLGGTTTPVTVTRRDSVLGLTVRILAAQILANGAYTLRVTNPPFLIDTLSLGGGTDTQALTVQADRIVSVDVAGTDTLLNAGDRSNFITLRFRDRSGNLVNHPAGVPSVSFAAAPDTSLPLSFRPAPAQGSFPVLQTGVGTYRLDTLRFFQAGAFQLLLDTSATGGLLRTGADFFRVMPLTDSIATFEGLPGAASGILAGDTIPSFTTKLVDKFGNFTDFSTAKWSFVRTTGLPAGGHSFASSATVRVQRLGTGYYRTQATTATVAGLYTYTLAGVPTTLGERTARVLPLVPMEVDISSAKEIVVAGAKQSQVQLILTDRFGNRTDHLLPEQRQLWFSNSTDATILPIEAFTQAQSITQRVITSGMHTGLPIVGVYDVPATAILPFAGKYSFAVAGVTTTTGTTAFEVIPAADFVATFVGVKDTITAGEELPTFTVSYRDKQGNPTDNGVGRITYVRAGGSSTATIAMTRLAEGEYRVSSTVATIAGNYTLGVRDLAAVNLSGNRTFVVRGTIASSATFAVSTSAMKAVGASVTMTVTYKDRFNNLTDMITAVKVRNDEFAYIDTVTVIKKTTGVYTATKILPVPGLYLMELAPVNDPGTGMIQVVEERGRNEFGLNPYPAYRAVFTNVKPSIASGDVQTFTVALFDRNGAETDYLQNILPGSEFVSLTGAETRSLPARFLEPNNPAGFHVMTVSNEVFTAVGNYTLSVRGVAGIRHEGQRTFVVTNGIPASAVISGVTPTILAGASQAAFTVTFRDQAGSLSNFTGGVTFNGPASGTLTLTRISQGVYQAVTTGVPFAMAGTYTLSIAGITVTGTTSFAVTPRPEILPQITTIAFGGVPINESVTFSVTVQAVNLSNPITITAPTHWNITSDGQTFAQMLTLTPNAAGIFTLTMRFMPSIVGTFTQNITFESGSVRASIAVSGTAAARTTVQGAVRVLDGKYFVDNRLFFPLGWSQLYGVGATFASIPENMRGVVPPIADGIDIIRNVRTTIPGLNIIEHEAHGTAMDLGYTVWNRAALRARGLPNGSRGLVDYNNIDSIVKYVRVYLDSVLPAGVKFILPIPRHFGDDNNLVEIPTPNGRTLRIQRRQELSTVERLVQGLSDHPKMFGWWFVGEPEERFRQVAHERFFARGPANNNPAFDNTVPFFYGYTKPNSLAALRDFMRNQSNESVNGSGNAWFRTQNDLEAGYTRLKSLAPNLSFLYMIGPHSVENTDAYLSPIETYGAGARSFDDLQAQTYLTDTGPNSTNSSYLENRSYRRKPMAVDDIFRRDPANYDRRWYTFDIRPQPSYYVSYTKLATDIAREHYLKFHPTGTGVVTIKGRAGDLNDDTTQTPEQRCLSCAGEGTARAGTLTEQMYYLFSKFYWMQERETPRVVNYAGLIYYSHLCASATIQAETNSIIRLMGENRLGEVMLQPKINPDTFVNIQAEVGAEQSVKTIVRQFNGFYYLFIVNNQDNEGGGIPATTERQRAQVFVNNPITVYVPDNRVITSCEELILGQAAPVARTLTSVILPSVGARQRIVGLDAATPLPPAGVRIFRFRIAHPTTTLAALAQTLPAKGEAATQSAETNAPAGTPAAQTPNNLELSVAPNPTQDATTLRLDLPQAARITLTLRDIHGRTVKEILTDSYVEAGTHSIPLDTHHLPSGVYACTLNTATARRVTMLHIIR